MLKLEPWTEDRLLFQIRLRRKKTNSNKINHLRILSYTIGLMRGKEKLSRIWVIIAIMGMFLVNGFPWRTSLWSFKTNGGKSVLHSSPLLAMLPRIKNSLAKSLKVLQSKHGLNLQNSTLLFTTSDRNSIWFLIRGSSFLMAKNYLMLEKCNRCQIYGIT